MFIISSKIKGYEAWKIKKRFLKKDEYFVEIKEIEPNIKEIIEKCLEDKNMFILGFEKNKHFKSIYLLRLNNDTKVISLERELSVDEITKDLKDEFEKSILDFCKESINFGEYTKIQWRDVEYSPETIKIGKDDIVLGSLVFCVSIILGLILNHFIIGMALGIVFGASIPLKVNKKRKK